MLHHEDDMFMAASIPSADRRKLVVEFVKGKSINFKILPVSNKAQEEETLVFDENSVGYTAISNFAHALKNMSQGVVINENAKVKNYMMCFQYQHFVEVKFINSKYEPECQNNVTVNICSKNAGIEHAAKMLVYDVKKITNSIERGIK